MSLQKEGEDDREEKQQARRKETEGKEQHQARRANKGKRVQHSLRVVVRRCSPGGVGSDGIVKTVHHLQSTGPRQRPLSLVLVQ